MSRLSPLIPWLMLCTFATLLALTARYGLGYPICGTDEQNYLQIFAWLDNGGEWPISGPGYAQLILQLRHWSGCPTLRIVSIVAIISSGVILPLSLLLIYRASFTDSRYAWYCLPWLFSSSYFLGAWLEGRPQQLGMVLVMLGAWHGYRDLQQRGRCSFGFFLLWALCCAYHALSFIVLSALIFGFWAWRFISGNSGYIALMQLLCGLALCLTLGVFLYPLIVLDLRINHVQHMPVALFYALLIGIALLILCLLHYLRRLAVIPYLLATCIAPTRRIPAWPWLLALTISAALLWQYAWLDNFYQQVATRHIIWYQGGNILLAALFLTGVWRCTHTPNMHLNFFLASSFILMAFGAVFLLLTPWLRDHNWTLRLISYWTWYAAPLAAWGWLELRPAWRWGLLATTLPLMLGGLSHVAYAPTWTCVVAN